MAHSANPNPQYLALCLLWESGSHSQIQVFSSFLGINSGQEVMPEHLLQEESDTVFLSLSDSALR